MTENDDLVELVPPSPTASSIQMSQSRVAFPRLPRLPSLDINSESLDIDISLPPLATGDHHSVHRPSSQFQRNHGSARSSSAGPASVLGWMIQSSRQPSEDQVQSFQLQAVRSDDSNSSDSEDGSDVEIIQVSDSDSEVEVRAVIFSSDDDSGGDGAVGGENDNNLVDIPADTRSGPPENIGQQIAAGESQGTGMVEPGPSSQPDPPVVPQPGSSTSSDPLNLPPDPSSQTESTVGNTSASGLPVNTLSSAPNAASEGNTQLGVSSTPGPSTQAVRLLAAQGESPAEFRSPKRKRIYSPGKPSTTAENGKDDDEDDGDTCPICFEPWTTSGSHRVSCLKCGHLFGQSCIDKWLKGQGGKCPQCNAKAKRQEIRVLYAKSIKALDTTERDRALQDLEKEREVRKKMEMEGAQLRLQYQMTVEMNNRLQLEVQVLKSQLRKSGGPVDIAGSCSLGASLGTSQSKAVGQFVLDRTVKINQAGNCRVIAYCAPLASLVASAPSSNPLFPGFGVKLINTLDTSSTQFYTIHSKPIRDLAFHPAVDDGMLLSCGLDKKVKMTSLLSGAVVQMYETPMPAWSCVWNAENSNFFYAGLQNGDVLEYDIRNTEAAVRTLNGDKRSPVASLSYLSKDMSAEFRSSGLLVGQLDRVSFFENLPDHQHRIHILPLEGSLTSLQVEPNTRHILASFRPTGNHPTVRHQLCKLISQNISADLTVVDNVCSCTVIHTFHGGRTQTVLSRNSVIQHPGDGSRLLVCGGDEPNKSVHIWDSATGQLCQRMVTGDFTIDLSSYKMNNTTYLAALSDKQCRLFKFT